MRSHLAVLVLLAAVALPACGDRTVTPGRPAERPYVGPLSVAPRAAIHPRAGAAGDVVECRTWGQGGLAAHTPYAEGATAETPAAALEVARREGGFGGVQEGLVVAKEEVDRVLYVVEVDEVVKQAVIVRQGPATDGAGGRGWYVESWAHCDYSELPRSFTESIGLQLWTGRDGRPAPTTKIQSWTGPAHCDWQSMTFLHLEEQLYVREPQPELEGWFLAPFDAEAQLPSDAVDTGFSHDGDRLWLSADGRQVYVGTPRDLEAWPRAAEPLGCA